MPKWVVRDVRSVMARPAVVEAENATAAVRQVIGKALDLELAEGTRPGAQWRVERIFPESSVVFSVRERW